MTAAIEFGEKHKSCTGAMGLRVALGPSATQADWWKVCPRGDWLIWQLERVGLLKTMNPPLHSAMERTITRAIRRGQKALRGNCEPWTTGWRRWARLWLSGEDRSRAAAAAAASAFHAATLAALLPAFRAASAAAAAFAYADAAYADAADYASASASAYADAAYAAEQKLQARDIRREIPEWPGSENHD